MSLRAENINYIYNKGTAMESYAVRNVSFEIEPGEIVGIIGHTGSGKSTMIQMLNGLIKPCSGKVYFDGADISGRGFDLKRLRRNVGLVFQYPEYQLFEDTVFKDVCFGPGNLKMDKDEIVSRAETALLQVGISREDFNKSPFDLSGGQKRRVAIAGVLAMNPGYLILDEPTAGLDPAGRDDILGMMRRLRDETGAAVLLVSHCMEDVASYVDRILVMNDGELVYDDVPGEVFRHYKKLELMGLSAPQMKYVAEALRKEGFDIPGDLITVDEVAKACLEILR